MTLGEFIKRKREGAKMAVAKLQAETGQKTWHGVQDWEEHGVVPKAGTLEKIANALGLSDTERRELSKLAAEAEAVSRTKKKRLALVANDEATEPQPASGRPTALRLSHAADDLDRMVTDVFSDLKARPRSTDTAKFFGVMRAAAAELATYDHDEAYAIVTLWAETAIELWREGATLNAPLLATRSARKMLERQASNDTGVIRKLNPTPPDAPTPDEGHTAAGIRAAKGTGPKLKRK